MAQNDPVNHPAHYTQGEIECIDALEAALGDSGFRGYCLGNVMKYIWRHQTKVSQEDLRKAKWYLERIIGTVFDETPPGTCEMCKGTGQQFDQECSHCNGTGQQRTGSVVGGSSSPSSVKLS